MWLKQRCKWVKKSRTRKKAKKLVGTFIFGRGVTRVLYIYISVPWGKKPPLRFFGCFLVTEIERDTCGEL